MPDLILQLIIVFLICGFCYWAWLKLSPFLPIAEPFASIINVLIVIPILNMLGHARFLH